MKTLTIILIILLTGVVAFSQSTTYNNNYGTNYMYGETGNFNKSSFSWTITQNGNVYNIKTNITTESLNVTYSYFDKDNNLYAYKVVGTGNFDGSRVKVVMTNGKLSDYAKGVTKEINLLAILFIDDTGYMYKLNK